MNKSTPRPVLNEPLSNSNLGKTGPCPLPLFLQLNMMLYGMEYLINLFHFALLAVSLLPVAGDRVERRGLDTV